MSSVELTATIKAVDQASATMAKVGDNTKKAMENVEDSTKKADFSMKQFVTTISGVMTAGFALYNMYDRIQDAQLAVKKAQDTLTSAQISAKSAQDAYNSAVEKYGVDSDQARDALEKLELAQSRVATSQEMLEEKQSRVNEAMVQMAIQAVPTLITGITSLKGMLGSLSGAFGTLRLSASAAWSAMAGPLAVLGISIPIIAGAVQETNELKAELDALGMTVADVEAMTWEYNRAGMDLIEANIRAKEEIHEMFQALQEHATTMDSVVSTINEGTGEIADAFQETYNEVVGGSSWPDMWNEISKTTKEGLDENIAEIDRAMGEIRSKLERPFYMEVVLTVNAKNIAAQVQAIVAEVLKSVVIEKTSTSAATSRIRVPTTTKTTTPTRTVSGSGRVYTPR